MIVNRKMAEEAWHTLNRYAPPRPAGITHPLEQADEAEVQSLYRGASKAAHPDAGGSLEKFAEVDRAKHVLLEWLKREETKPEVHKKEDCQRCAGKGYIELQRGFRSMRVACPKCRGSGDADYDHDRTDHFQGR